MPELPEVETIKRGLAVRIIGQTILSVEVLNKSSFPQDFGLIWPFLEAKTVIDVTRFAKVLVWQLSGGQSLLFHLKMTGQIVFVGRDGNRFVGGHPSESMQRSLPVNSTRAIFSFETGDKVFFNDQRKFGWIKVLATAHLNDDPFLAKLGPEPLGSDFTTLSLSDSLARHGRAPVKAVLLDQTTVAGIGNIYADESLHLAKIHPARLAGTLSRSEISRLHRAIVEILSLGIAHGGTSFTSYVTAEGEKGDYLQYARVFRRDSQACPVCGAVIKKIRVAGRGTHYCPTCQKAPK
ncbi:MAG: bifunctional DNA-formamidopyrimidine glycosylase/DNA-(apurinic or apyrimidinic site) lyase [Candidatus Saccharimonadia bacterium]